VSISFTKSTEILNRVLDLSQIYLNSQGRIKSLDTSHLLKFFIPYNLKNKLPTTFCFLSVSSQKHLTPHTKIHSRWIKDLNIRLETIKLLEKKHRGKGLGNEFLDLTPRAKAKKTR